MSEAQERRRSLLTDNDLVAIKGAFKEEITNLFENIGYDITTAHSRGEIHKDHTFVRAVRKHKNRFVLAFVGAVGMVGGGAAVTKDWIANLFSGG